MIFRTNLEAIFSKEAEETAIRLELDLDPDGILLFVSALGDVMKS